MIRGGRRAAVLAIGLLLAGAVVAVGKVSGPTRAERGWVGLRIAWPTPDERVRIGADGSLDVAVYRPKRSSLVTSRPLTAAVLLIHGNREEGSDAPLYRILARRLADRNAIVYSLSLPGFGKSNAIAAADPVEASRLFDAVRSGIEYLRTQSPSPSVPRILTGHSLGANLVLASCSEPDLAVEAIEPGRRIRQRVVDPPHPDLADFTEKLRKNVKGGVIDADRVRDLYAAVDPERPTGAAAAKSCDVIYSRLLPPDEVVAVTRIGQTRGAEIIWMQNRGHDNGAISLLGGVMYPAGLIELLADTILSRSRESRGRNE